MSDYFYMSDNTESMPMLAMKFSRSKRIGATALPFKGVTEFGVKTFARFIQSTGVRRFVNHSNGEPALKALKDMAARTVQGVEHIPKEVPVGDHAKNGEIECAVRELKRQMRAVRLALETNLGRKVDTKDPVLAWMPTFAATHPDHHCVQTCRCKDGLLRPGST